MSYITIFRSGCMYYRGNFYISWKYPRSVDIIRILWILSAFRGFIHVLWILYTFFINIYVCEYYLHFVDTIGIGHIKIYLACNVRHVLHSFVVVMGFFCHITRYLACNVRSISHILLI